MSRLENNIQYMAPPTPQLGSDPGATIERGAIAFHLLQLMANHAAGSSAPQLPDGAGNYVNRVMQGLVHSTPALSTRLGLSSNYDQRGSISTIGYDKLIPDSALATKLMDYGRMMATTPPKTEYSTSTAPIISYS